MAKRRMTWDQNKIDKYIKEGRGQGSGKEYKPWITIQDFPSLGRCSRLTSWKTKRVHQFMSDNETSYFYLLEWSDKVIDIREQYPLLDIEDTLLISEDIGVKHPSDNKTGTPYILTTDFMITVKIDGKEKNIARTIKPAADLEKQRVVEKFEIERRYWEKRNVDWGIVTEKEISKELVKNIEWVHTAYTLEPTTELTIDELIKIGTIMKSKLKASDLSIRSFTAEFDQDMKLESGTALYLFRHLMAKKEVILDMQTKIDLSKPVTCIQKIIDQSKVAVL